EAAAPGDAGRPTASAGRPDLSRVALISVEESPNGISAQTTLRQETDCRARRDQVLHLVATVGGDQDDSRLRRAREELAGDREAVLLAQLDVDEREVG